MSQSNINIDIANKAVLKPIGQVAKTKLGIDPDHLESYGKYKAKLPLSFLETLKDNPDGKLILV
ncbi:MAG: formate--tetrahydrofolate ligase, partial [Nitrospirota bacterium]|nr:formate--tetrahydrofolate ligase [Nitrospirota bacterium]